jgi:hypothetical protein
MNFTNVMNTITQNAFVDELSKIAEDQFEGVEDMSKRNLYTEKDFAKYNKKSTDTTNKGSPAPKNAGAQIKQKKAVSYGS